MGQKVHPLGFRLGINKTWKSRWYADKAYGQMLHEDLRLRRFIKQRLFHAGISRIEIERTAERVRIFIHTARPGIIIGKKGAEVDKLKSDLVGMTSKEIQLEIVEVRKAELDAQLVAEQVASQLERRVAFRRAMKKAVTSALRLGAKGVRIACAGRLAGAEIARPGPRRMTPLSTTSGRRTERAAPYRFPTISRPAPTCSVPSALSASNTAWIGTADGRTTFTATYTT